MSPWKLILVGWAGMAVVILCLCAATAQSNSRDWTNAAGNNNWFTTNNWNPAGAPDYESLRKRARAKCSPANDH